MDNLTATCDKSFLADYSHPVESKRGISTLITGIFISLALAPLPALSAGIPGTKCTKAGNTRVVANLKFTCVKSGKKLIWNKGVKIVSTKTTENSSPVKVEFVAPTSFADLYERRSSIAYTAWNLTSNTIKNGKSNLKNVTRFIGPNTLEPKYKTPELAYSLVSKAFTSYITPSDVYLLQYGKEDISWAEDKIKTLVSPIEYENMNRNENGKLVSSNCNSDCFGAKQVTAFQSDKAFVLQGIARTSNNDPMGYARWNLGHLDAHEFFHAMQRANSKTPNREPVEWPPSFLIEGGASLVQNLTMSHHSYEEYMKWRGLDAADLVKSNSKVNAEFLDKFLDLVNNKDYWRGVDGYFSYNLGSRIMEIFVALKGPGVLLDLQRATVDKGYEVGFESIFGISWSEASPIISKTILQMLKERS